MKRAFIKDVQRVLDEGGSLEFIWKTGVHTLITKDGERIPVDSRSYSAFVIYHDENSGEVVRTDVGDTEEKGDLVITWRRKQ